MGGSKGGNGNTHINPLLSEPQVGRWVKGTSHQVLLPGQACCGFRKTEPPPRHSVVVLVFIVMTDYHVFTRWKRWDGRGL